MAGHPSTSNRVLSKTGAPAKTSAPRFVPGGPRTTCNRDQSTSELSFSAQKRAGRGNSPTAESFGVFLCRWFGAPLSIPCRVPGWFCEGLRGSVAMPAVGDII